MDLDRRQCILVDENLEETAPHVKMEAFEEYSKSSCLLECRARRMFEECNCLPYYYPNFQKVWDMNTTCTKEGLACLANITREMMLLRHKFG